MPRPIYANNIGEQLQNIPKRDQEILEDIFNDVLNKHNGLLGLLFGYGKNNSLKFQKEYRTKKMNALFKNKTYIRSKKLKAFHEQSRNLYLIDLPRFAADLDYSESKDLYKSYEKTRIYLTKAYKKRNFLKITLEKFISN